MTTDAKPPAPPRAIHAVLAPRALVDEVLRFKRSYVRDAHGRKHNDPVGAIELLTARIRSQPTPVTPAKPLQATPHKC